jgi:hypothetical protein
MKTRVLPSINAKALLVTSLLLFSILTLNISLFNFAGFTVTGAVVSLIFIFITYFKKINKYRILYLIFFLLFLSANAVTQIEGLDAEEFLKSFLLTLCFLIVFFNTLSNKQINLPSVAIHYVILFSSLIIVTFQFIQIGEQFFLNSHKSWFYLAEFSTSTAESVGRFQAAGLLSYMRPISIYYEPSFLGFVLLLLYSINGEYGQLPKLQKLLGLGIFCTLSSTIIFFFILYLVMEKSKRVTGVIIAGGICLTFILSIVFYFPEIFRLNEMFSPGTSGHERLVRPFELTFSYLQTWPFGLALGQSSVLFNNSLFLLVLYTGVLFPLFIGLMLLYVYKNLDDIVTFYKFIIIFCALLFLNGALFTLEGTFFIFIINYFLTVKRNYGIYN